MKNERPRWQAGPGKASTMSGQTKNSTDGGEFQMVPLSQLRPSPTNPRKSFSKESIAELAQSMAGGVGIIEPLVVRALKTTGFEIVAGERRFRAAKVAGLETVPAVIRELTHNQVLEMQLIENLQKEGVHPLEEGRGYQRLIDDAGWDVNRVADRVGKSVGYVYAKLKLAGLDKTVEKAFVNGKLSEGHAIQIARLHTSEQQRQACQTAIKGDYRGPLSVRGLGEWIKREVYRELDTACFPPNDADLVPEAGPCVKCPKRAANGKEFFPGAKPNSCTDPSCYEAKITAFIERQPPEIARVAGWNPKTERPAGVLGYHDFTEIYKGGQRCPHAQKAIWLDGPPRGEFVDICAKTGCEVHRHGYTSENAKNWEAEQKKQAAKQARETAVRAAIYDEVLAKVPARFGRAEIDMMVDVLIERTWHEYLRKVGARYGIKKNHADGLRQHAANLSDHDARRFLVELGLMTCLAPAIHHDRPRDPLLDLAKSYAVDVGGIRKEALQAERAQQKRTLQTSAKSQAKGASA